MKNKSVMTHAFSRTPQISLNRSVFQRDSGIKTTFDSGYLIPIFCDEILPGDGMNVNANLLIRLLSPAIRPIMDNLYLDTFWFFVPNRLVWSNFKKFMGEQDNPADSIAYLVPQITSPNVASGGVPVHHLFDYFGIPTQALSLGGGTTGITVNNLHGRAYNLIWNTWFRSQDLQNSVTIDLGDGPDTWANYNLLRRGKRHDFYTVALPWVQKGGTAVSIPLGTSATVKAQVSNLLSGTQPTATWLQGDGTSLTDDRSVSWSSNKMFNSATVVPATGQPVYPANLYADLSTATAATINALRDSISLQQFLENDARSGTRYTELIKSHFQVTSPDARLQRPELLATSSHPINLNPVARTDSTPSSLSAFGTGSSRAGFTKSFTEHGVILGLCSVRADLNYDYGVDKMWSRRTRYDFFWPEFQGLGEQPIYNREIFANCPDGTGATQKDGVFGYVPRHEEYRFKTSKLSGLMRTYVTGTLSVWHAAQAFAALPTLNSTFIQDDPPIDRCITTPAEPHWLMDGYIANRHVRPVPTFGVPGLKSL